MISNLVFYSSLPRCKGIIISCTIFLAWILIISGCLPALDVKTARDYYSQGMAYRKKGQIDLAIKSFTKAIELDSENVWAFGFRGRMYEKKAQYDLAINDFTKAIELDPENVWALTSRGYLYSHHKHQYDLGINDFNKAIELDPDYDWGLACRSEAYIKKRQYDLAIKDLKRAIELDPELEWYHLLLKTAKNRLPKKVKPLITKPSPNTTAMASVYKRWGVVIGISNYKNAGENGLSNLIFADDDAKAFSHTLNKLGWNESHIKLLLNEEATERNIKIALESWLTKTGPNDQIVLFWAGHGFPDPEDPEKVYFACYDTDINIPATGYRMDKVRTAIAERNAKNVIVLVDTCHAGKLITRGKRGMSIVPQIDKMQREKKIPKGWVFMVGADTDRQAIEHTSWTNGAFTHCLVNALSGKADGYQSSGAKDGIVTMGEIKSYLYSVMPDETQKVLGVAKRPIITTSTGDPDIWNLTLQAK